jgi:magnesium chelatase subunit D
MARKLNQRGSDQFDAGASRVLQDFEKEPLVYGLLAAVLEPALRSVLLLDGDFESLLAVEEGLQRLLTELEDRTPEVVWLTSAESEDDLWGRPILKRVDSDKAGRSSGRFEWMAGRLVQEGCLTRIVVIPDLANLSLAAARACLALIGCDVATLQRHARDLSWKPRLWWIAGCASDVIGTVSPHLLDRFLLRLRPGPGQPTDRVREIERLLHDSKAHRRAGKGRLHFTSAHLTAVAKARSVRPNFSPGLLDDTCKAIREHFGAERPSELAVLEGIRRDLTLARLARALARLRNSEIVERADLDSAKGVLRLGAPLALPDPVPTPPDRERNAPPHLHATKPISDPTEINTGVSPAVQEVGIEGAATTGTIAAPTAPDQAPEPPGVSLRAGPFPEDRARTKHEFYPLRLPYVRQHGRELTRGPIVGNRSATSLKDLALVDSIFHATIYSAFRRRDRRKRRDARLTLEPRDLREYRRLPLPEEMLVLVLDYTCLDGWPWEELVLPHLKWAYQERANVCLVQVGAIRSLEIAAGAYPLRANKIAVRHLLHPRLSAALRDRGGAATPLAHGLDLAIRHLRSSLRHGRNNLQRARLVVLTDGRGNVPLQASLDGALQNAVLNQGVEDALAIARRTMGFNHVSRFLLDPQPEQLPNLPRAFATALGATIQVLKKANRLPDQPRTNDAASSLPAIEARGGE